MKPSSAAAIFTEPAASGRGAAAQGRGNASGLSSTPAQVGMVTGGSIATAGRIRASRSVISLQTRQGGQVCLSIWAFREVTALGRFINSVDLHAGIA